MRRVVSDSGTWGPFTGQDGARGRHSTAARRSSRSPAGFEGSDLVSKADDGWRYTLTDEEGQSVDLVGYSQEDRADRIGGGARLRVMVFGDLSTLLQSPEAVIDVSQGGLALSAAALTVAKLMTIRLEKGSKDKLQALLVIDEMSDNAEYLEALKRFLSDFEPDRVTDAVADAQMAMLAITTDAELARPEARDYQEMRDAVERGLAVLEDLTGNGDPP